MSSTCLIVGAGIAGLSAGSVLAREGWQVTLLDKGQALGGRMATRNFDGGRFDYGAQFFTLRDAPFAEMAAPWVEAGVAVPWDGNRYRVPGGMRTITAELAKGLNARTGEQAIAVSRLDAGWAVEMESGEFLVADSVILTPPVPQSLSLLESGRVSLSGSARSLFADAQYRKTITILIRVDGETRLPDIGYLEPERGNLSWVADNHVKGVSPIGGCLTLHADASFSGKFWEASAAEVTQRLLEEAKPYYSGRVHGSYLHRWRYAEPVRQLAAPYFAMNGLVVAGDAFGGPRVGGAAASGLAAAAHLLSR